VKPRRRLFFVSLSLNTLILASLLVVGQCLGAEPPVGAPDGEQVKPRKKQQPEKAEKPAKKLTPEEREAKRREIKVRLDNRLAELRAKQTNGVLTAAEKKELGRCEQILKRFEESAGKAGEKQNGKPAPGDEKKGRTCERR
jgi:acyl-CoA reductase-like NAD-dependent aldehyde dehydrogenase